MRVAWCSTPITSSSLNAHEPSGCVISGSVRPHWQAVSGLFLLSSTHICDTGRLQGWMTCLPFAAESQKWAPHPSISNRSQNETAPAW